MARKKTKWMLLIQKYIAEIKKEGKIKGLGIMKEAIKRAKKVYKKEEPKKEKKET